MTDFITCLFLAIVGFVWWRIFTQKPTDTYDSGYSFMWVIWTPLMLWWVIGCTSSSSADFHNINTLIPFISATFFGPVTLVVGILKAAGFGKTFLGQWLGFAPPAMNRSTD